MALPTLPPSPAGGTLLFLAAKKSRVRRLLRQAKTGLLELNQFWSAEN
jgi:hypothetical protein